MQCSAMHTPWMVEAKIWLMRGLQVQRMTPLLGKFRPRSNAWVLASNNISWPLDCNSAQHMGRSESARTPSALLDVPVRMYFSSGLKQQSVLRNVKLVTTHRSAHML